LVKEGKTNIARWIKRSSVHRKIQVIYLWPSLNPIENARKLLSRRLRYPDLETAADTVDIRDRLVAAAKECWEYIETDILYYGPQSSFFHGQTLAEAWPGYKDIKTTVLTALGRTRLLCYHSASCSTESIAWTWGFSWKKRLCFLVLVQSTAVANWANLLRTMGSFACWSLSRSTH
jgi:hypothetical protein